MNVIGTSRKSLLVVLLVAAGLFVAACGGQASDAGRDGEAPLRAVATHSIIGDIAANVGGEEIELETLVGPGEDPHVFEPSPSDGSALSEADLVFENGLGYETWLDDMYASSGSTAERIVLTDGIEPIEGGHHGHEEHGDGVHDEHGDGEHAGEHGHEGEEHGEGHEHGEVSCHGEGEDFHCHGLPEGASCELREDGEIVCEGLPEGAECHGTGEEFHCHGLEDEHGEERSHEDESHGHDDDHGHEGEGHDHGHSHGEFDPHVWGDVENAVSMTEVVRDALVEADPDNADAYRENASEYVAGLRELDASIEERVASVPEENRKLITAHDTFGYFARAYGFEVVGTAIESFTTEVADPSAGEIAALSGEIREAGVPAIFPETTTNEALMERIASEAGVDLAPPLYTDALGEEGSEADTYIGMMEYNASTIAEALGG